MAREPAPADPMNVPDQRTHTLWPPNGELSNWIQAQFAPGFQGWALDVGASDGISVNSTYLLEKVGHWTVLCVEPNPVFSQTLLASRAMVAKVACDAAPGVKVFHSFDHNPEAYSALRPTFPPDFPFERGDGGPNGWTTFDVQVETVDRLLVRWEFPRLDALCIDTEGTELEVLEGCDLVRWRPRVIVCECWQEDGGSIEPHLHGFGYRKQKRMTHNDLYLLDEVPHAG